MSFPALLGGVLVLGGFVFGGDWLKERREVSRPLPSGDPPNVLLIVLDTVRADRLSLYGYRRPTSPTLERLAKRGIRFDEARQQPPGPSPRTPACLLAAGPMNSMWIGIRPLGTKFPTLAEYLGSRGYATAGFVANILYCSYEFGLDRGFTHYEDYVLEPMTPLRMCCLGDLALKSSRSPGLDTELESGGNAVSSPERLPVLAVLGHRFQERRGLDQSRVLGLVVAAPRAGTSVLRLPQLL